MKYEFFTCSELVFLHLFDALRNHEGCLVGFKSAAYDQGAMQKERDFVAHSRVFVSMFFAVMVISGPMSPNLDVEAESPDSGHGPINLAIVLHMHQPYYKNIETDFYELPWVRVHGSHEYIDSPGILGQYPGTNVTYNIVPSLIEQLEDYSDPETMDMHLDLALSDWPVDQQGFVSDYPNDVDEWNLSVMMFEYFRIQPWVYDVDPGHETQGWMSAASSSYGELRDARDNVDRSFVRDYIPSAGEGASPKSSIIFHPQKLLDLTVLFHLFQNSGPLVLGEYDYLLENPAESEEMQDLFKKTAPYTVQDLHTVITYQREQMLNVMPLYSNLANSSQVELTTTPRYHPILPLLAMPGWTLDDGVPVEKTSWIDDVEMQIEEGLSVFEQSTGIRPSGMWPSEQAVSQTIVGPMVSEGISWAISDKQVLAKSTKLSGGFPSQSSTVDIATPWIVSTEGVGEMVMVFRETGLSDSIGFQYGDMDPNDAVADFISKVEQRRDDLIDSGRDPSEHLLTVAADGENWLFMSGFGNTDNGREFLHLWFDALQDHPSIRTMTPGQFISEKGVENLPRLSNLGTGSWVMGDLNTWAGELEETIGWHRLVAARQAYVSALAEDPSNPGLEEARHALMAAQGSDWFWWYGADQDSGDDSQFDALFRGHLRTIYHSLGLDLPADLLDLSRNVEVPQRVSTGIMEPLYDGHEFPGEWDRAAEYDVESDGGIMDITSFEVGFDAASIHIKLGLENIDDFLDLGANVEGTPHVQIYFMEPNAQDNNVAQANFHTYYGREPLGMPTTKMLWLDFEDIGEDGGMSYNSFSSVGGERWKLEEQGASGLVVASDVLEIVVPWSEAGLEPNGFTRIRAVSSLYESRSAGGGADWEMAPGLPALITMPNLEKWVKVLDMSDPIGDEKGDGDYTYPQSGDFSPGKGLFDLEHVTIEHSSWNVRFTIKMVEVTNGWNMLSGWSHANIQIYVDSESGGETDLLDGTFARTAENWGWESAVMLVGEPAPVYALKDGSSNRIVSGIEAFGDETSDTIVATISKNIIDGDIASSRFLIVVGSQDGYGFGKLRAVDENPSTWTAGGGAPPNPSDGINYHPTIWDILLPPNEDQEAMLGSYDVDEKRRAELTGVGLPPIEQQITGMDVSQISGSAALVSWATAKSGPMEISVVDESNGSSIISDSWTAETSQSHYSLRDLVPGRKYTVVVSSESSSMSMEFETGLVIDESAPEILGLVFGNSSGEYSVTFFSSEPASVDAQICNSTACSGVYVIKDPIKQVHRFNAVMPNSGHNFSIKITDTAGISTRISLVDSLEKNPAIEEEGSEDDVKEDDSRGLLGYSDFGVLTASTLLVASLIPRFSNTRRY